MKKRTFAFALATGLLLAGCASESPDVPGKQPVVDEGDGVGYITVNFANDGVIATRADENEDPETMIANAALVFKCDDDDEFTRYVTNDPNTNAYWTTNHNGNQCAIVKLEKLPVSVACVVNYITKSYDGDLNASNRRVETTGIEANKYFHMSSSKYYDAAHNRVFETPVTPEMLCDTKEAAANNTANPLIINVERYVAKVEVKNVEGDNLKLENGELNPLTGPNANQVKAKISFTPEYTFLTAQTTEAYTIKKLPEWNKVKNQGLDDLMEWDKFNTIDEKRSSWVDSTLNMDIKYETLANLQAGAKTFGTNPTYYTFDNLEKLLARRTSVVVAGKYTVKDDQGNPLADTDGTFYLVAFRDDSFEVYKTKEDAIKAMGGEDGDELVPEGVIPEGKTELPLYKDQSEWTGWTGWMEIKGKDLPTRCIKYSGGYGYYAQPLYVAELNGRRYRAVVRNHRYAVSITGISGMGVGIPDPNQPIIPLTPPNPTDQDYFLHMSVKVLPWREVKNSAEWK